MQAYYRIGKMSKGQHQGKGPVPSAKIGHIPVAFDVSQCGSLGWI